MIVWGGPTLAKQTYTKKQQISRFYGNFLLFLGILQNFFVLLKAMLLLDKQFYDSLLPSSKNLYNLLT